MLDKNIEKPTSENPNGNSVKNTETDIVDSEKNQDTAEEVGKEEVIVPAAEVSSEIEAEIEEQEATKVVLEDKIVETESKEKELVVEELAEGVVEESEKVIKAVDKITEETDEVVEESEKAIKTDNTVLEKVEEVAVGPKEVIEAVDKAAEIDADVVETASNVPEEVTEKAENVVEGSEKVIETVDKFTEEVEEKADDLIENKEKVQVDASDKTPEMELKGTSESKEVEEASIDQEKIKEKIPVFDSSKMSLEELAVGLQKLMEFPVQDVKKQFEILKSAFSKNFRTFIEEKKAQFIKEGGEETDFSFSSPVKMRFNELVQDFKKKRQKYYKDIEFEQKENLQKKLQLIEDLKSLIDNADPSSMYKNFRSLQDEWRKIGQIPHTKYNDVWRTYHHHVERFYDLLHLNNDLRDLDFKHNLEEKTKLVEKVEELAEIENVNHAFKELQILHRMWKEDIGPVSRVAREEIWDRFSKATKKIHDKRHDYQNQMDSKFKANVSLKLGVIEKIKEFKIDNDATHKAWQEGIKKMEKLRNEFFAIGRVPRSKNEEVWQLFKDATKNFNKSKNAFYKNIKKDQLENLSKKMVLVEQAESLKDSEDWDSTTEVFKKIQADWRKIGHVPRKDSDKIWKRFKEACNFYFDKLHNMQDGSNKEQVEVFNNKKLLLDQFKAEIEKVEGLSLELINSRITEWKAIGAVPAKMRHIDAKFNKAIDLACKKINIDKDEATLLKFKNVIDAYVDQNDVRKIDNEQLFVRRKIDEVTKEIKLLENNISFISNATKDNPLVMNVYKNIENHNKELKIWQKKLAYLKQIDY